MHFDYTSKSNLICLYITGETCVCGKDAKAPKPYLRPRSSSDGDFIGRTLKSKEIPFSSSWRT